MVHVDVDVDYSDDDGGGSDDDDDDDDCASYAVCCIAQTARQTAMLLYLGYLR